MPGTVFKRCGCRDADGQLLGAECPKLTGKNHGTWSYKVELPAGPDGQRRRAGTGGFGSKREAEVALTDLQDKVNKRTHVGTGKQTLGEYLEQWLAGKAALRSTTAKSYREHLDLYLLPALGHIKLTELNETDVEGLFAAMRLLGVSGVPRSANPELTAILAARKTDQTPKRLSSASQRRIHATLRAALNTAVKRRLIAYNPALHIELPSGRRPKAVVWNPDRTAQWRTWRDRKRELTETLIVAERKLRRAPRTADKEPLQAAVHEARQALSSHTRSWTPPAVAVWTPAQTGQFLDSIEGHRMYALYHLIAFRGLRRGEAVGLPWTNVDLDNGFLTVSTQIVQLGWATEEAAPKADSEGVVALDRATVEVLRTHRERQQEEADAHPTAWQHTGLVFTREDGTAIHPELVSRTFDRLVRDADLPPIRLHDLRHGAATLALAAGVDLKVVSAMLRHSSITITADTYVSVLPETARAAAEAAAAVVPRKGRFGPTLVPHDLENDSGPSLAERKARSERVRRQGLEPRTR
jgi:integrase